MMEGLQLWKKFEAFKSRACDEVGFFIVKMEIFKLYKILTNRY